MNSTMKYLGIGILVAVVLVAGFWIYHTHDLYEKTYSSKYNYEITLETDSVLNNVTLYLPLPVCRGESDIGDQISDVTVWETFGIKPSDWEVGVTETEYGKMLKISADKISPEFHSLPVPVLPIPLPSGEEPEEPGVRNVSGSYSNETPVLIPKVISISVQTDHDIQTKNPVENEPLLFPKLNITQSIHELPGPVPPDCYTYESRIYAEYTTTPEARVSISVQFTGRNEWWVYMWSGTMYGDNVNAVLSGEQLGWSVAQGEFCGE
jgi:hypothetical protein